MRRTGPYLLFLLLAATALAWQLGRNPAREAREIAQERFDYAVPPLDAGHTVGQTFVSRQAGLKAVELLLVRYQPDRALPPEAHLILALERLDDAARPPVTATLSAAGMTHNQRLRFAFPPLADSRDAAYRFTLSTDGDHGLGFWACSSDAYADGTLLSDGQEAPGDIYFTTHYDYALRDALSDGLRLLARHGRKLPALFLLLGLPGIVASLYLLPPRRLEIGVYLALVLALSMAAWPLLLLWTSLLGLSLAGWRAWIVVLALIAAGAYRLWRRPGLSLVDWSRTARDPLPELALALILLLAWGVRLLQVRELVVPAWVDSVHHTLITQLISERGRVPSTLEPYLPLGDFHYHYGFHALAAVLTWLGGLSSDAAVLLLGQALNALAALPLYALASEWAGRRWAGVGAALVAGALSYMPAYYVSWGRYTQLAGLNLLPLACLLTGWLLGGERRPLGLWAMALLLLGGLMVTHYRVLVFYAAFWVIYAPLYLWRARTRDGVWWDLARVGVALAVGALVLTAPWSARFAARILPRVDTIYGGWAAAGDPDTALPMGLLKVGWTPRLLYLAAAGAVWALLRRRGEMLLVPLWVGLCLLVANLHLLGLPTLWLIHNESVVISFWLPVGLLCGWVLGDLVGLLAELWARFRLSRYAPRLVSWLALSAALVFAVWGSWRMVDTVNPVTVIATAEDVRATAWIREHVPEDALILVNTRKWQGELRMGSDGGYWIPLLTRRRTTMPCILYYHGSLAYREQINGLAWAVEEAENLDDPALIARLAQAGVTHVYVGEKGGRLLPKELAPSPHFETLYTHGPVRVYGFVPDPS